MARRGKSKKRSLPRGARGPSHPSQVRHDLDVPLPIAARSTDGRRRAAAERRCLLERLRSTGYGTVAFSHTVYGRPHAEKDAARTVMPWTFEEDASPSSSSGKKDGDAESGGGGGDDTKGPLVLRRLNVVIEEASDVVRYSASASSSDGDDDPLASYDLIAVSARSDPAFTAACSNATVADIFVLDYTAGRGGVQLPHRVRAADVRAATERGAAFEIPYGPAILDPAKRKALVRTALELRNACASVSELRPRIVLSSGSRMAPDGTDKGALALRTPGDMVNVLRAVLGFDDRVAFDAAGEAARMVVDRGRARRTGRSYASPTSARAEGKGRGVSADVVATEGNGADAGLRWAADEEAPLAGKMAEELKEGPGEPKKKVAKGASSKDVKVENPSKSNSGGSGEPADDDGDEIGHEDGFMAL